MSRRAAIGMQSSQPTSIMPLRWSNRAESAIHFDRTLSARYGSDVMYYHHEMHFTGFRRFWLPSSLLSESTFLLFVDKLDTISRCNDRWATNMATHEQA
jgi:hypothetical protein